MLGVRSPGREVIDYHNGSHYISILGGIIAKNRARRLTRLVVEDPLNNGTSAEAGLTEELAGLDDADINFLRGKGVFNLPPKPIW